MSAIREFDKKGNLTLFSMNGYECKTIYSGNNEIIKKVINGIDHTYGQLSPNVNFPPNKTGMFFKDVKAQMGHEAK